MKWISFLLLFTILFFEYSCTSDDINDNSKRNTHWAWWVDATSNKGGWIPLSNKPVSTPYKLDSFLKVV